MQFLVQAKDYTDEKALERRMAAREAHLSLVEKKKAQGKHLLGAALLDGDGKMIGSVMIVDYPDREAVDEWLKMEPYMTEKVWASVEVTPCRIAPPFAHLFQQAA